MQKAKKPAPRKPMAPRKPTTGVRKPLAKPTRNSGPVVALPNGSTVGLRDIGKVKPTPKPKTTVIKPKEYTPAQYDALLRKAQKNATKKR